MQQAFQELLYLGKYLCRVGLIQAPLMQGDSSDGAEVSQSPLTGQNSLRMVRAECSSEGTLPLRNSVFNQDMNQCSLTTLGSPVAVALKQASADDCCAACSGTPGCTAYNYCTAPEGGE